MEVYMKIAALLVIGSILAGSHLAGCGQSRDERSSWKDQWKESVVDATRPTPDNASGKTGSVATVASNIDDATITAKVKNALLSGEGVPGTVITVDTVHGTVILIGRVTDASQGERAVEVAREVAGVKAVLNKLTVGAC
jgi:osmotically-inducible protein OsmY